MAATFRLRPMRERPEPDVADSDARVVRALEELGRPVAHASIRARARPARFGPTSMLGGVPHGNRGERWPRASAGGDPLEHVLQIRVDQLPVVPAALRDTAVLTLFASTTGEIEIRRAKRLVGLSLLRPPKERRRPHVHKALLTWTKKIDYPDLATAHALLRDAGIETSLGEIERICIEHGLDHASGIKVGGWPTTVADLQDDKRFVLQCTEGPFGQMGVCYVFRDPKGRWSASAASY